MADLTPSRKADRTEMLRQFRRMATEIGARIEYTGEDTVFAPAPGFTTLGSGGGSYYKRAFHVSVVRGDLRASLRIDGARPTGGYAPIYVISWNSERRLSSAFEVACGPSSVNAYHRCKATGFANSFESILEHMRRCFAVETDGNAYEKEAA